MNIKIKSQSPYIFTIFLAGSLCGLTNYMQADPDKSSDDHVETAEHRLQITGATRQILDAIAGQGLGPLATSAQAIAIEGTNAFGTVIAGSNTAYTAGTNNLTALSQALSNMQGTGFNNGQDTLHNISANTTEVPLATNAQAVILINNSNASGTALTPGATYTATTNDLTSLSLALSTIEGTNGATGSFTMALASLYIISRQTALAQVIAAESNPVIVTPLTAGATFAAFNSAMQTVLAALQTAMTTPNHANILAVQTALAAAGITAGPGAGAVPFSTQGVTASVQALTLAVNNWLAFYPTGS